MGHIFEVLHGMKPVLVMIMLQFSQACTNILYKLAANDGMNLYILVAYRLIFATAFMAPLALIFERKTRTKLTFTILFEAFLCGLFGGSLIQNLYIASLALTSATFASSLSNLLPAVTFVLAISLRLENLGIRSVAGKLKVLGTLIGIGGASLLTFYKGPEIDIWSTNINLLHHNNHSPTTHQASDNKVLGCFLALGSCVSNAIWLIIQTKLSKRYPCHYSCTTLIAMMGSIQSSIFAFCIERDSSKWKLGWSIRLLTASYTGFIASGLIVVLITWCVSLRGPLYVAVYNPLTLVLVVVAGSLLLQEKLHLGSIIGAVLIVSGSNIVLWAKSKEIKKEKAEMSSTRSAQQLESIEIVTHCQSISKVANIDADVHSIEKQHNDQRQN